MTAPTINGTRYPQPIEKLLPAARALDLPDGQEFPSRNRLMREFRIGAPKADELLARLKSEHAERTRTDTLRSAMAVRGALLAPDTDTPAAPRWDYAAPIGPDPEPGVAEQRPSKSVYTNVDIWGPEPADTQVRPPVDPVPVAAVKPQAVETDEQPTTVGHPDTPTPAAPPRSAVVWPVILLALPAFVAIWSGWVGLGGLTGFGVVHPLPGIADGFAINTAITLPIGVETYGAYALYVWLSGRVPERARQFAKWSAIASLLVGALGQVAYHLLVAAGVQVAPWWITTAVACLPVAVLGMGAALAHLVRSHD
ncbi:ABC transporter permease [Verrucosispora sp. ts21]|uniref:ABC transporter permease n=1 Tax=Verrucosispora sp. ts21 TaxID=2069341 RepID=UPI000C87E680|nr:ABC transporter permease [Verrucosispora sp. ts21]PMR58469.1 ABC transporter permease [Verrucosispora sp. ts21]